MVAGYTVPVVEAEVDCVVCVLFFVCRESGGSSHSSLEIELTRVQTRIYSNTSRRRSTGIARAQTHFSHHRDPTNNINRRPTTKMMIRQSLRRAAARAHGTTTAKKTLVPSSSSYFAASFSSVGDALDMKDSFARRHRKWSQ